MTARVRVALALCMVTVGACGGSSDPEADTSATATSLATTAEPAETTEPASSTSPASSAPPTSASGPIGPPINAQLAGRVPTIDGYTTVAESPAPWLWSFYSIPEGHSVYPAAIVAADGTEIGRLIIAAGSGGRPPIDTYVDEVFAEEVQFVADSTYDEATQQTLVVANTAIPAWSDVEHGAVVTASVPDQDAWQWAWGADGMLWIVRGSAAAEGFVHAVLQQQVPAIDPYDQQGMLGDLYDHTPVVDGYTYFDFPRGDTLASFPDLIIPNCYERVYLGYVRPAGSPSTLMQADDLAIAVYDLADVCVSAGFLDDLRGGIEAQGWAPGEVGGVAVMRDATNIVLLRDDILVHLRTGDPATFDELAPFIDQFLANQPS